MYVKQSDNKEDEVNQKSKLKFDFYNKLEAVIEVIIEDKDNKEEFRGIARGDICDIVKNVKEKEYILIEGRIKSNNIIIDDVYSL